MFYALQSKTTETVKCREDYIKPMQQNLKTKNNMHNIRLWKPQTHTRAHARTQLPGIQLF